MTQGISDVREATPKVAATLLGADRAMLERLRARLDPADAVSSPQAIFSDYDLNGGRPGAVATLRPAAVLAVLAPRADGLAVILTRRADHLSRHAGQVAFPGGRIDPGDHGPAAAALREAYEEIGLPPERVELLGGFDAYETVTGYCVAPFVGLAPADFTPRPDPAEVAEVFEAPLRFLLDPANIRCEGRVWRGATRRYYAIEFEGRRIWGATAGMIAALRRRLED